MHDSDQRIADLQSLSTIEITPDLLASFLDEGGEHIATLTMHLVEFERQAQRGAITFQRDDDRGRLNEMFRVAHSLKSLSATFGFDCINKLAHHMESVFDEARAGRRSLDTGTLGTLLSCLGVLSESIGGLETDAPPRPDSAGDRTARRRDIGDDALGALLNAADRLEELAREIRVDPAARLNPDESTHAPRVAGDVRLPCESLESWLSHAREIARQAESITTALAANRTGDVSRSCEEIQARCAELCGEWRDRLSLTAGDLFVRFDRLVADMAKSLGRRIVLRMQGLETRVDVRHAGPLADAIGHALRNAVDHGIEPPDERQSLGKPPMGTIQLSASIEGEFLRIGIRDDGRGVDAEALRKALLARGMASESEMRDMPEKVLLDRVFEPGVSTAGKVTEYSGRGVGMDVVRATANRLGGSAEIASRLGEGATVTLRIPRAYQAPAQATEAR